MWTSVRLRNAHLNELINQKSGQETQKTAFRPYNNREMRRPSTDFLEGFFHKVVEDPIDHRPVIWQFDNFFTKCLDQRSAELQGDTR